MSVTRFLTITLGLVFVISGYVKVADPQGFALAVANYQMLSPELVRPASLLLAWLELVCGLALVFRVGVRGAALTVSVLMLIFLAAMGYNVSRGLDVACGCFSTDPDGAPLSGLTLARDVAILLLACTVYLSAGSDKRGQHRRR